MLKIIWKKLVAKQICSQKIIVLFVSFFLNASFQADNHLILHFYEPPVYKGSDLPCDKENGRFFSRYVKKKYKCFRHNECIDCKKITIEKNIELKLNLKSLDGDIIDNSIYLNTNVLKYNEFLYFFNLCRASSEIKENFETKNFSLILRILDILKFKKDKNFKEFIRILLLSVILNAQSSSQRYNLDKESIISSSLLHMFLGEFGKIYLFETSLFKEYLSDKTIKEIFDNNFNMNYRINTKFVHINSCFIVRLDKYIRYNLCSKEAFMIFFNCIRISSMIMVCLEESLKNISFDISKLIFSYVEEICFHSRESMKYFEYLCDSMFFKHIKILVLIYCNFYIFSERIFENFKSLECIYLVDSYSINLNLQSMIYSYLRNLLYMFYDDISSDKNASSFFEIGTEKYDKPESINEECIVGTKTPFMISREIKDKENYMISHNIIIYVSKLFEFNALVSDSKSIKKLCLTFKNIHLKTLYFDNSVFITNIKEMSMQDSELTNGFLRSILTITSLEKIEILRCKVCIEKMDTHIKHLNMRSLSIFGTSVENSDELPQFINCMTNLNILTLQYNKTSSVFSNNTIDTLKIGYGYKEGSIFCLFSENNLASVRVLFLFKFTIGNNDINAMKNCKKIQKLVLTECEFRETYFYQLFDSHEVYIIEVLELKNISLSMLDCLFISKLRNLKFLNLKIKHINFDSIKWFNSFNLQESNFKLQMIVSKKYWIEIEQFKEMIGTNNFEIILC
ncbi:hypothetical protein CWI39_1022p0010 [Hamiltosporidium magnivora]|uniref:Leucine-rich repeat-containing protein n=1 Tax=Hamiltosporidium magnivora TaxID=148818 RepID=A0A4Q9L8R7_9MICR|nr:hypothetical protein CWI39_1022p0010 [Hamiltosporidium magnivora]